MHAHHHHGHHHDDGHGHGHGHGHHHHHPAPSLEDRRWVIGVGLNLAFVAAEGVAGFWANSTALLADAGHNLSDVAGLLLAGTAVWLSKRAASPRRTYGWGKATVLAALVNALALVFACGMIALEAVQRLGRPVETMPGVVMAVAAVGVLVNGATALLFMRGRKTDANVRGAFLHMAADAGISAGVIVAAALIAVTGAAWIDPLVALLVVVLILAGTWGLLKEAFDLIVDAAPRNVDLDAVRAFLLARPGVCELHDLHVWPISTSETALTVHLVRPEGGDAAFLRETAEGLRRKFGVGHATVQLETESLADCSRLH
ncbi:cation diffusion facilitator family transporter [Caulobacter sp. 17J80-11]|uniref:cation diffusion facilitator family transporter n=1 Tax=Caulobacter sp. 17J80-11 TaxID=2763502 RepID=UPI00165394DF|nr:cation transporter [Caulobacter sp. 17J80-11]